MSKMNDEKNMYLPFEAKIRFPEVADPDATHGGGLDHGHPLVVITHRALLAIVTNATGEVLDVVLPIGLAIVEWFDVGEDAAIVLVVSVALDLNDLTLLGRGLGVCSTVGHHGAALQRNVNYQI